MIKVDISHALTFIQDSFNDREKSAFKLLQWYAVKMMNYFMEVQGGIPAGIKGEFWTNHTFRAVQHYLAYAFARRGEDGKEIGIRIQSLQWYSKYLEYGHELRFASFPTMIEKFWPEIVADIKYLYGDTA